MARADPDLKVILTHRPAEEWIRSVNNTIAHILKPFFGFMIYWVPEVSTLELAESPPRRWRVRIELTGIMFAVLLAAAALRERNRSLLAPDVRSARTLQGVDGQEDRGGEARVSPFHSVELSLRPSITARADQEIFLRIPAGRLLIYRVQEGWEPLCKVGRDLLFPYPPLSSPTQLSSPTLGILSTCCI